MLVFAGPAAAVGSFTWSASIKQSLTSREWTQAGGTLSITANLGCGGKTGKVYYITPQRKASVGWTNYTARAYLCGWSETNTWSTSAGTYRFVISTTNEGVTLSGSGTTRYP